MSQPWYVYMLMGNDHKTIYTGISDDVKQRVRKHNGEISGGAKNTKRLRPWTMQTWERYDTKNEAASREREIKKWRPERKRKFVREYKKTQFPPAKRKKSKAKEKKEDFESESESSSS